MQSECVVMKCPQKLPPIFNGEKLVVYALIKPQTPLKVSKCVAILSGNVKGEKQEHKVPFILDSSTAAQGLPVIHHLAAKALITDWESEQKEKKSIVDLSIESCVISSYTAFIAIDEESSEPVSGAMKTYDIRARRRGSNLSSLYSGSDSDSSCYDCGDSEDDEDEEMEGGAAEPVGFSGEKINQKKRSVPKAQNIRRARYDADADEKPMMDELCEAELEYELESWSEGEGHERVLKQRLEKDKEQAAAEKN